MAVETFAEWRDRLLDFVAIYGHTACREGVAIPLGGEDLKLAGKEREKAWASVLEIAFNPPASVDPHVRAAKERTLLDVYHARYREARMMGMPSVDAREHAEAAAELHRRTHG